MDHMGVISHTVPLDAIFDTLPLLLGRCLRGSPNTVYCVGHASLINALSLSPPRQLATACWAEDPVDRPTASQVWIHADGHNDHERRLFPLPFFLPFYLDTCAIGCSCLFQRNKVSVLKRT